MDKDSPVGSALPFYIGTYTGSGSRGIYKGLLDNEGHIELKGLAAETENPSFLAFSTNGEFLLAVNEIGPEGKLESFRIEGDSLILVSRSSSGGAHPCFVSLNNDGYILTANYSSGTVGLLKMNNKGELNGLLDAQQHRGSGTTNRQKGPHAHSAMFEPASTGVISVDLGTNELWFSELDTIGEKLLPAKQGRLAMDPGAGPRHLAFHPTGKWLYVINELNSTVTLVKKNETGIFERGPSYSTLPASYEGDNYCADIHISSDGNYVYASNRGHNSIAIFKVENKTGSLIPSGHSPTCGEWPRNFALSPGEDYLLVANQHSNNIVSLRRDRLSGSVEAVDTIKVTSPVCILFR
ncbi:MAG: lactonase family protein [Bacteroidota bacterium]|nr:lactonase family protein [Bacteroidota bacterium]